VTGFLARGLANMTARSPPQHRQEGDLLDENYGREEDYEEEEGEEELEESSDGACASIQARCRRCFALQRALRSRGHCRRCFALQQWR
jgi:hypothetical protein